MQPARLVMNFGSRNAFAQFILPMTAILTVASVFASLVYADEVTLEHVIYSAIETAISPVVVFYVAKHLTALILRWFAIADDVQTKAQIVCLQLMLLYFFVTLLLLLIPGSEMLKCLYIYAFYMLWFMAGEYLGFEEKKRMFLMFVLMVVGAIAYNILPLLMRILIPNHP